MFTMEGVSLIGEWGERGLGDPAFFFFGTPRRELILSVVACSRFTAEQITEQPPPGAT